MMKSQLRRGLTTWAQSRPFARLVSALESVPEPDAGLLRVVTYHRVDHPERRPDLYPGLISASPAAFEVQIDALRRRYRTIAVDELLAVVRGQETLRPRSLLITFDDAYDDFARFAWPVLERHRVPAVLFVPTGYPDSPRADFWWDRLYRALERTEAGTLATPLGVMAVASARERSVAFRRLRSHLKQLPHEEAMTVVDSLCIRAGHEQPSNAVLGWVKLRELARRGLDLAPHSRSHARLSGLGASRLRTEIEGSLEDLEAHLGRPPLPVFAYPDGDCNDAVERCARECGIEAAFSTRRGLNHRGRWNVLRLNRINVGPGTNEMLLRAQLVPWMGGIVS